MTLTSELSAISITADADTCYRAIVSKDVRFDGVFFVGVKSTGIYCRPICPVRTPKRESCTFFARAVEAEREGYRACFRCRPELAPGHGVVDATSRLVQAAVHLIHGGYLNRADVPSLAARLGVTDRHLRRVLAHELGVTPTTLAQSRRLAMAKQLLQETSLSMTDVAFASGFSSVRRFNDAFRKRFQRAPTSLRRAGTAETAPADQPTSAASGEDDADTIALRLEYRPPLPWSLMMEHGQARLMTGVEWIDGQNYLRTASWGDEGGWLQVTPIASRHALQVTISTSLLEGVIPLLSQLRRKFDLDAHPDEIAAHLRQDGLLQPVVDALPGLRLTGAFDPFAQMVRVILGQHVSVKAATTLCDRLIDAFGAAINTPYPALSRLFPTATTLATCPLQALIDIGLPETRARALQGLAQLVDSGAFEPGAPADVEAFAAQLLAIRGIGPWTVKTILMRVLGDPDAFPASDLEVRKALGGCSAVDADARAEAWRPWRAYAAMYLWHKRHLPAQP